MEGHAETCCFGAESDEESNPFGLSVPVKILFGKKAFKVTGDFNLFRVNSEIHYFIGEGYKDVTPQVDISFYIIFKVL